MVADPQTVGSLRSLMREAVASGGRPRRQPGRRPRCTGRSGRPGPRPGSKYWAHWFVGYRGGVAFAVLELTKSPSTSAVPLGASFLSGLG